MARLWLPRGEKPRAEAYPHVFTSHFVMITIISTVSSWCLDQVSGFGAVREALSIELSLAVDMEHLLE